jgi:uncharacterized protein YndB with AHSA1/START domain
MSRLYVDKTVEVDASAARVWEVLTCRTHTQDWASEFSLGGPQLHIESDWTLGSPVIWKEKRGGTVVEGTVTASVPHSLLRFTVFDPQGPRPLVGPDDGITFKLTERAGKTVLWVSHGDFSRMADGARYRDLTDEIWDRALARIRRLAEGWGPAP